MSAGFQRKQEVQRKRGGKEEREEADTFPSSSIFPSSFFPPPFSPRFLLPFPSFINEQKSIVLNQYFVVMWPLLV
jgi:hypothetical protein